MTGRNVRVKLGWLLPATSLLTALAASVAQAEPQRAVTLVGAEHMQAVVPHHVVRDLRSLPIQRAWQPGDPIKEIPKRRRTPIGPLPATSPTDTRDPLVERQAQVRAVNRVLSTPSSNIPGQGFSGVNPPDTTGDVGPTYFIQAINSGGGSSVTVYNKSDGSVASGPFTLDNLAQVGTECADGLGDPIVLYDELAQRWLLSEFSNTGNALCVYISQTSNPISGGWHVYQFTAPSFPDYPKYSVWPDGYYVTSNEGNVGIYALDRQKMLAGQAATMQRFAISGLNGFGFQALTPADHDGSNAPPAGSNAYFVRHRDDEAHNVGSNNVNEDYLEIFEFNVDWANSTNSTFTGPSTIAVAEFDSDLCGLFSFSCIPQPDGGTPLDPLREAVMWRLQYRNFGTHEALVGNFSTDVNGSDRSGVRWFELRRTGGAWSLHQEGTWAPDAVNRWMGASSMDKDGNIAVVYNVSSTSVYPGIRFAGREAGDTAGVFTQTEQILATGAGANTSERYGDYQSLSVDPADGCTFWFTGEHNPSTNWATRIASFKFSGCGGVTANPYDLNSDGQVDSKDIGVLMNRWGGNNAAADFNNNGTVDSADLLLLLNQL